MHFSAGETIIAQGAEADRVFTLLEGKAEALRDGVKVGEVHADEIFGALAVFTRQRRMASVVAISDCTVLAVPKDEFIDLEIGRASCREGVWVWVGTLVGYSTMRMRAWSTHIDTQS